MPPSLGRPRALARSPPGRPHETRRPDRRVRNAGELMRIAALVFGIVAVLMGSLWIGQGAGRIHWPASSFMIDQRPWIWRGAVLAAVGLAIIIASRLRR